MAPGLGQAHSYVASGVTLVGKRFKGHLIDTPSAVSGQALDPPEEVSVGNRGHRALQRRPSGLIKATPGLQRNVRVGGGQLNTWRYRLFIVLDVGFVILFERMSILSAAARTASQILLAATRRR